MNVVKSVFLSNLLYEAIQDVNYKAVKMMLLEKCANPNYLLPMRGISPLHLSIGIDPYNFAFDSTKLILENGGNPNVRSDEGLTPLHIAVSLNRIKLIELLLTYGANPCVGDGSYNSPLDYATEDNFTDILSCFHTIKPDKLTPNASSQGTSSDLSVKSTNSLESDLFSTRSDFNSIKNDANSTKILTLSTKLHDADDSDDDYFSENQTTKPRKKPKRDVTKRTRRNNIRQNAAVDVLKMSKMTSDESGISSTMVIDASMDSSIGASIATFIGASIDASIDDNRPFDSCND